MHAIHFVDDSELPDEHDFLFLGIPGGGLIFYKETALCPRMLEDSWTAYRALAALHEPPPGLRVVPAYAI